MMKLRQGISVVIPVYNSMEILEMLIQKLNLFLSQNGSCFEIILINDGSKDASWEVVYNLSLKYPSLQGINLSRNYGQHNALLCGIRSANYDVIVTMDDDLQHPPNEIKKLTDKLDEGFDVVYGMPTIEQHGLWRDIASRITKIALHTAMGAEVARNVSAFRAFRTELRAAFAHYDSTFVSIDVLLTWGSTRFAAIPVNHDLRVVGKSTYTFRKLITHALNMMTGFSVLPLQLASLTGFVFTIFGFAVLTFVLIRYIFDGGSVAGFPFLASIIAIFSGAQLFSLGIIGEYLARIHFRSMDKPAYVIRSHVNLNNN
jgi:glycosyltransferase involved in cell wall biosynthesis